MREIVFSILVMTALNSCSPLKGTGSPVNDYLDSVVVDKKSKIVILDEKIHNKKTLGIFKGNFMFDTKTDSYVREGKPSALYNEKDWQEMDKKYSYDSIAQFWKQKDFTLKNIITIKNEQFLNGLLYKDFNYKEYAVYGFSDPIFYGKNQYMIFTVLSSSTRFGADYREFVIVMKKQGKKWRIVENVFKD